MGLEKFTPINYSHLLEDRFNFQGFKLADCRDGMKIACGSKKGREVVIPYSKVSHPAVDVAIKLLKNKSNIEGLFSRDVLYEEYFDAVSLDLKTMKDSQKVWNNFENTSIRVLKTDDGDMLEAAWQEDATIDGEVIYNFQKTAKAGVSFIQDDHGRRFFKAEGQEWFLMTFDAPGTGYAPMGEFKALVIAKKLIQ